MYKAPPPNNRNSKRRHKNDRDKIIKEKISGNERHEFSN